MPLRTLVIAAVLLATCPRLATAQIGSFTCEPPQLIGLLEGLNNPTAMTIDGNYAYVIETSNTFTIVDLSNPTAPQLIARVDIPLETCRSITIIGHTAYLSMESNEGVLIFNIEDKNDPWFVRAYYSAAYLVDSLPRSGSHLYTRYSLINITRPFSPGLDRFSNPDFQFSGYVIGYEDNTIYTDDLTIFDVSDPFNPVFIEEDFFSESYSRIERQDQWLVTIADGVRIGLKDPLDDIPNLGYFNQQPLPGVRDLITRGDILIAATSSVRAYANGYEPLLQVADFAGLPGMDNPIALKPLGNDLVVVNDAGQLAIYQPPRTNPVGAVLGLQSLEHIDIAGNIAVTTSESRFGFSNRSMIYDISNPTRPLRLATFPYEQTQSSTLHAGIAYVSVSGEGIAVFDLTDPSNPMQIGLYDTETDKDPKTTASIRDLDVYQDHALAVNAEGDLVIFDATDPTNLVRVADLAISEFLYRITIQGHFAFISSNTGLIAVDIADPSNPIYLSEMPRAAGTSEYIHKATLDGELLYTAEADNGYRIYDFTDPSDPVELAHFPMPEFTTSQGEFFGLPFEHMFIGDTMIIALSSGGIGIFDNTNPFQPILMRHAPALVPQGGNIYYRDIALRDNLIYTAAGTGIRIYDLNDCALPCAIDLNNDGQLNFFDVSVFLVAFSNQEPLADLNNDGNYDFFDVSAFLVRFKAGCP